MNPSTPLNSDEFRPQKKAVMWVMVILSLVGHLVLAALLYGLMPRVLSSISSSPANTMRFILIEAEVKPAKPVVSQKPVIKPEAKPSPRIKKNIITAAPSTKAIEKRQPKKKPKPINKQRRAVQKAVEPKHIVAKTTASNSPAPLYQQASRAPKPSYRPKPTYPTLAKRRGIEGVVTFEVFLASSGRVTNAIITESSGSSLLDKSALKTIKTWRFPANRFNALSSFKQRIVFQLVSGY